MCSTCGCGMAGVTIATAHGPAHHHEHEHAHPHAHGHGHGHAHVASGEIAAHGAPARVVRVEQDLLAKNDGYAAANRRFFAERGVFAVNLMSGPGAGKTALLVRTAAALRERAPIAVIEGDQQTSNDAERIRATGVPSVQINTGKGCHLDAHMVGHAVETLVLARHSLLFIENVGNLVCPAAFDLGEGRKVVILSVTEGDDKPEKYPDIFAAADLLIVNKIDLLPHVSFDLAKCVDYAQRVNAQVEVMQVSATTGEGLEQWYGWINAGAVALRQGRVSPA